jgi:hypothetical protein
MYCYSLQIKMGLKTKKKSCVKMAAFQSGKQKSRVGGDDSLVGFG